MTQSQRGELFLAYREGRTVRISRVTADEVMPRRPKRPRRRGRARSLRPKSPHRALIRGIVAALDAVWSEDETLQLARELAEVNELHPPRSPMRPSALVQDLLIKGMFKEEELRALLADVDGHKPPQECAVKHTFP